MQTRPPESVETVVGRASRAEVAELTAVALAEDHLTYEGLVAQATLWRDRLLAEPGVTVGSRVCTLIPPGPTHVAVLLGIWSAGCVAVPVSLGHPPPEVEYVLADADPALLIGSGNAPHVGAAFALARAGGRNTLTTATTSLGPARATSNLVAAPRDDFAERVRTDGGALMIYTSGTTGRPKGVVTTHGNISAQVLALVEAWEWREDDRILHVLPLHHIHGLVNVLSCALWSGARCEFCPPSPEQIWGRLAGGEITLFMAVPTLYRRLIQAWQEAPAPTREHWSKGARDLRLMVSGSAALPVATLERWKEITGHVLVERYGMTEIGMCLSNPLRGERRPGHVGLPLPGVEVRITGPTGETVGPGVSGQIEVRGPQVFSEYWRRPGETAAAFRAGWFQTGDEGVLNDGYYRILGRRSVDILKTGGYKVSALEIEDAYRAHPSITDLAVVGVPDPDWGDRVCAAIVVTDGEPPSTEDLRSWGKQRLAPYKVPQTFLCLGSLPRNAMGKVQKPELVSKFSDLPHPSSQPEDAP